MGESGTGGTGATEQQRGRGVGPYHPEQVHQEPHGSLTRVHQGRPGGGGGHSCQQEAEKIILILLWIKILYFVTFKSEFLN